MSNPPPPKMKIIGYVRNALGNAPSQKEVEDSISRIAILPEFLECLDGIEDYRFIIIVFWMDKMDKVTEEERSGRGSFANTRPRRPNPIGITIVPLLKREDATLIVKSLDALDGSPVLDIKPYKPWSLNRTNRDEWRLPDINNQKPRPSSVPI